MREYVIEQLRERVSIPGKAKTWIDELLSDDQLYKVFIKLRNGESAKNIAKYIQSAWGIRPDSTVHSLSQGITKFKKRIAHLLLAPQTPESISSPNKSLSLPVVLEGAEGLESIANLQMQRINNLIMEERETGVKINFLNKEIQSLAALSKVVLRQKEWELSYDGRDPVQKKRFERKQQEQIAYVGQVMGQFNKHERNTMAVCLDNLVEKLKEKQMKLMRDDNGEFFLLPPNNNET